MSKLPKNRNARCLRILFYVLYGAAVLLLMQPARSTALLIGAAACMVLAILCSLFSDLPDTNRKRPLLLNLLFHICWICGAILMFIPNRPEPLRRFASALLSAGFILRIWGDNIAKALQQRNSSED